MRGLKRTAEVMMGPDLQSNAASAVITDFLLNDSP